MKIKNDISEFVDKENLTIKEFSEAFNKLADEISSDGVSVSGHPKIETSVSLEIYLKNGESFLCKITGLDVQTLFGCGCWSGITIVGKEND